ncbi:hypothetical protein QFC24_002495 [Naganishia onofrii]|uniref:Uncharacterized protein n=1 Tax=Naganishia onofrii TaxID=1851511 RepID=A0ACC2XRT1_9TREE|nr:hypothetical protein QFC24_002495 [Naganishia onofrii]
MSSPLSKHLLRLTTPAVCRPGTAALRRYATIAGDQSKETVVVIGGGWAGYNFVRKLDKSQYNLICISGSTNFVTTPLLPSATSGALGFRDIVEPLRSTSELSFHHSWAEDVDFNSQTITCVPASSPAFRAKDPLVKEQQRDARAETPQRLKATYKIKYDKLVIAAGSYNQTFGTPGVEKNAFFLKDIEGASAIRYQMYELLDIATWPMLSDADREALLTWVIVGGGPTGSELAAELHDLVKCKQFREAYPTLAPHMRIKLIDAAPTILSTFDKRLAEYASDKFQRAGIEVLTSRRIKKVDTWSIETEQDGTIRTGLVVWSTGIKVPPIVERIRGIAKDKRGFLQTNEELQLLKEPVSDGPVPAAVENVYAMGDCAQIKDHFLPATAQVISPFASCIRSWVYTASLTGRKSTGSLLG